MTRSSRQRKTGVKSANTASGCAITTEAKDSGRVGIPTRLRSIAHQVFGSSFKRFMGCPLRHSSASSGVPESSHVRFRAVQGANPSVRARYECDKSRADLATKWQLPKNAQHVQDTRRFQRPLNHLKRHYDRGGGGPRVLTVALPNRSIFLLKKCPKGRQTDPADPGEQGHA